MTSNFASMKGNRAAAINELTQKLKDLNGPQYTEDERFWQPVVDKAKNGSAIIRFLPAPKNEDVPFVRIWKHSFKGAGGWYIENSLTTLGKEDPVAQYNNTLWNSTTDDKSPAREQARAQKRNLVFTSNIQVIKHPAKPDDEGKVFLYNYGKKIFDKINDKMNPPADLGVEAVNPFDLWEGANFRLVIRDVEGYRNYDKSLFNDSTPLSKDDEELEKIWESEYSLQALLDPKNFKSYEELSARLNKVLSKSMNTNLPTQDAPVTKVAPEPTLPSAKIEDVGDTEENDDLAFFKKLAQED